MPIGPADETRVFADALEDYGRAAIRHLRVVEKRPQLGEFSGHLVSRFVNNRLEVPVKIVRYPTLSREQLLSAVRDALGRE